MKRFLKKYWKVFYCLFVSVFLLWFLYVGYFSDLPDFSDPLVERIAVFSVACLFFVYHLAAFGVHFGFLIFDLIFQKRNSPPSGEDKNK